MSTVCSLARLIWSQVGLWLLIPIVPSSNVDAMLDTSLYGLQKGSRKHKVVEGILKSVLWCIWKTSSNVSPFNTTEEIKI